MLLDGAIKFARQAREGLAEKNYEKSFTGFDRCRAIVLELMTSIRPEIDPDLCKKVSGVYTYIFSELVNASFEKSLERCDRAIELLEYERETWVQLMAKLAEERAAGNAARAALEAEERPAVSLQG
jgi:flagellar protein FliS